jgi:hypothetical protein
LKFNNYQATWRVALTAYLISLESLPMFGTNHTNAEMVLGSFPTQTASKNNGFPESAMLDFARNQITTPNNFEDVKLSINPSY